MISLSSCSKSKRIFFSSSKRGDRDNCRGSGDRHCPRNLCNMASARDCQEAEKGKVSWQQSTFPNTLLEKGTTGHPSLGYTWGDVMKTMGTLFFILKCQLLQATCREGGAFCKEGGGVGRERGVRASYLSGPQCSLRGTVYHVIPKGYLPRPKCALWGTMWYLGGQNDFWKFKCFFIVLPRGPNKIVPLHLPLGSITKMICNTW